MERYFIFNDKNTWYDWKLILTAKDITPPEPKTNYVSLDGMSGTLDLSDVLTGEITYNDRTISMSFWTCEGSYKEREKLINEIVSYLHGKKIKIIEPDDTDHYYYGRARVTSRANNVAYAELSIECICEPWKYSRNEIRRTANVNSQDITNIVINNSGVKTLIPIISVTGDITIIYDEKSYTLTTGLYNIPDLKLYQGVNVVGVTGNGVVTFSYREAEL